MKRLLTAILFLLPLALTAQDNTWEQQSTGAPGVNPDAKYLAGAVTEIDGHVVFEATIQAPGKSKAQIYDIVQQEMLRMTKEPGQFEQSRLTIESPDSGLVVGNYQEWLVFKNKPLNLDRTRLFYQLVADCRDGEVDLKMMRIVYLYDEERNPTTYKAEEWITDKYGLTKKQNKLSRVSGKFRRKTIDRKDYLFSKMEEMLNKE